MAFALGVEMLVSHTTDHSIMESSCRFLQLVAMNKEYPGPCRRGGHRTRTIWGILLAQNRLRKSNAYGRLRTTRLFSCWSAEV